MTTLALVSQTLDRLERFVMVEHEHRYAVLAALRDLAATVEQETREATLRTLASATRKVLSPELVALVEAEMRRGLAASVREECGKLDAAEGRRGRTRRRSDA